MGNNAHPNSIFATSKQCKQPVTSLWEPQHKQLNRSYSFNVREHVRMCGHGVFSSLLFSAPLPH